MYRNALLITVFGLILGGCASDATMEPDGGTPSTAGREAAMSNPAKSSAATSESSSMKQSPSSRNRIAAGVEEDTLDSCLAHIPQGATAGQRMLAEQTCRRDYASRR